MVKTHMTELDAQCNAVLAVLRAADIPCAGEGHDALVLLRHAMAALRVPMHSQRYFEEKLREDTEDQSTFVVLTSWQWRYAFVTMQTFSQCLSWARHRVAIEYQVWFNGVICALMRHGWHDPATNHQPPPGQELDALEIKEHARDQMNAILPGMGDALSGNRPSTEEGRRLLWYRVVDDEGEVHMINDADMPEEEEPDEDA